MVENPPAMQETDTGDSGLISGSGRSPGGGNSNPLQHAFWDNPIDRGAWRATVHGVSESHEQQDLATNTFTFKSGETSPLPSRLPFCQFRKPEHVFRLPMIKSFKFPLCKYTVAALLKFKPEFQSSKNLVFQRTHQVPSVCHTLS